jgi:hyperosmotically inducible periplasmic protein
LVFNIRFSASHTVQLIASLIKFGEKMKKLIPFLFSGILVVGTLGCQEAPSSTNGAAQTPAKTASQSTQITDKTAKTPVASKDGKVHTTSDKTTAIKSNLKTEVSKKLQAGLPGNKLEVENKEGEIILKGTATSKEELEKAEKLIKQVKGVKTVKVEAKIASAKKL